MRTGDGGADGAAVHRKDAAEGRVDGAAVHRIEAADGGMYPLLPAVLPYAAAGGGGTPAAPVLPAFPGGGAGRAELLGAEALSREIERDARRYDRI